MLRQVSNQVPTRGSVSEELERFLNRAKSRVRVRVAKVRYRRLAKNATRAFVTTALARPCPLYYLWHDRGAISMNGMPELWAKPAEISVAKKT